MARSLDITKYHGIVCVSGDGILVEVSFIAITLVALFVIIILIVIVMFVVINTKQ